MDGNFVAEHLAMKCLENDVVLADAVREMQRVACTAFQAHSLAGS